MDWHDALTDYLAFMHAAQTASSTLRVYVHYLTMFAELGVAPYAAGIDDLARFLGREHWKPATRKTARSAVRSFYSWALLTGRMDHDPSSLLRPIRVPRGLPRPVPDNAVDRALQQSIPRDRLMVMLACYAGLRRAEIARVHRRDIVAKLDSTMVYTQVPDGALMRAVMAAGPTAA